MLGRCLLSILRSLQLSQCYSAVPQQWEVTGHWHLFRANGRPPSSRQQGAQHCSCEVHELAVALPGAEEKPTITGCRCNGSPHGKPLTCLKNCLHSPHPDDFCYGGSSPVHHCRLQRASFPPPWMLRPRARLHRKCLRHPWISGSSHAASTSLNLDSSHVPRMRCPVATTRQAARKTAEVQLDKELCG